MLPEVRLHTLHTLGLSAASGLVLRGDLAFVLGDDRSGLDRLRLADGRPLAPIPLLAGTSEAVLSKAVKPDLEALADLGERGLLALGSGSRPNRERAFRVHPRGVRFGVQAIDLSPLYARLRRDIGALNIEGAVLLGDDLVLAHRGVGASEPSCLVRLDAAMLFDRAPDLWPAAALLDIRAISLGQLDGVALGLTDLATSPDGRLHYLAAAEATADAYLDGPCRGSVIGCLDEQGQARTLARLRPDVKAEGLAFRRREAQADCWLVVTDADDPARRATLEELRLAH